MSKWNHNICWDCWYAQETTEEGTRLPVRAKLDSLNHIKQVEDICCYCGRRNLEGIYKRGDPKTVPCEGNHPKDIYKEAIGESL